ncbi:MAG: isoprenylcysteine carboxylmethyltransferase family protein, partial [Gemmatimonadota bacterium]
MLAVVLILLPLWFALDAVPGIVILAEALQPLGLVLALLGGGLWLWGTVVLVARGGGTPLPLDPPERLVVAGPYAWIRNPMHVGLAAFLAGVALLFRSPFLFGYAVVIAGLVWAYAGWIEEPWLERRYGEAYRAYRARVPAWWPRQDPGRQIWVRGRRSGV